jgi:hypothetical protein
MRIKTLSTAAVVMTLLSTGPALAGPLVVNCGPGQRAVVQNERVGGEDVTRVACVGTASRSWSRDDAPYRAEHRRRSAGQKALVIGGSAATGAGIGGIVKGGKGALIGAAIGGGAASIIEGVRH